MYLKIVGKYYEISLFRRDQTQDRPLFKWGLNFIFYISLTDDRLHNRRNSPISSLSLRRSLFVNHPSVPTETLTSPFLSFVS